MENLKAIVQAAGSSLDRAVRLGVFLMDMNDFAAVNEVYARYSGRNRRRAPPWKWPACRATFASKLI